MKRNKFRGLWYIPVMTFVVSLSACLGSGDETIVLEEGKPAHGILAMMMPIRIRR